MRNEITYKNVACIGDIYISNMTNHLGISDVRACRFELSTQLECAKWLDDYEIKTLKKYYGDKIEIKVIKMELM